MKKIGTTDISCRFLGTRFGPLALLWSIHQGEPRVLRIILSRPGRPAEAALKSAGAGVNPASCAEIEAMADQIAASLTGADLRFSLDLVRLDLCSAFQQKVLRAEYGIPRGRVSTYQRISRHLGYAQGAARAVGSALARNPFPIIIPCHRAIRSDHTLGGFQGGLEMKRALLALEGVPVDELGQVAPGLEYY